MHNIFFPRLGKRNEFILACGSVPVLPNEYSHSHSRSYFYSNSYAICVCLWVRVCVCVCLCARMGLLCAFVADACNKPKKPTQTLFYAYACVSGVCVCVVRSVRPGGTQNSIFHDSSSFEAFFARFVLATAFSASHPSGRQQQQQRLWQPFCLHLTQV